MRRRSSAETTTPWGRRPSGGPGPSRLRGWDRFHPRVAAAIALILLALAAVGSDDPIRDLLVTRANERLRGYTLTAGDLDLHPLGFGLEFRDAVLTQDSHPDEPVLRVPRLAASLEWRALLRGRVVGHAEIDDPVLRVDRAQLTGELEDEVPIEERGWREAVRAMYPLEINTVRVRRGAMTYLETPDARPLALAAIDLLARDIRNTQGESADYPSPVSARAVIFESGRIEFEGRADLLREPHPALSGRLDLQHVPLEGLEPVARRYGLVLERGAMSARGTLEYTPDVKIAELDEVRIVDLRGNWSLDDRSEAPARRAATAGARAARDISNDPDVRLRLRRLEVRKADLGFINAKADPTYRVFVNDATLSVEDLSNHRSSGTARVRMQGRLMDSGVARIDARFRPESGGPDFDLDLRLEDTELAALNDLLRAHAGVDVTSGRLSVYSEMRVRDGRVDGYVKPLFRELEVYDPAQDRRESPVAKLKEGAAELAARLLRNRPRQEVVTVVPISGPVSDPDAGTWQTLIGLLRNAFVQAILPGFEKRGQD